MISAGSSVSNGGGSSTGFIKADGSIPFITGAAEVWGIIGSTPSVTITNDAMIVQNIIGSQTAQLQPNSIELNDSALGNQILLQNGSILQKTTLTGSHQFIIGAHHPGAPLLLSTDYIIIVVDGVPYKIPTTS